ncbi:hypothetical protein [Sphingomonas bacterium]|uniref:hypothetical protein n=1 Tax=Sphingomonas bacterium TaxID=1895847 RepID=UPI00157518B1|nr:hypothetical protein [Sphingomonas bacterium]
MADPGRNGINSGIAPSRRAVIGSAGAALTSLAGQGGTQGFGAQGGGLAPVPGGLPLDARAHGVVGDGRTDDTRAVQAFLDLCAASGGRIAHFGAMVVRITGPLRSQGVGIVFEPASYGGAAAPGFVASGAGYTALTVTGSVADLCVTLTGEGTADIRDDGRMTGDRRPRINGISFGSDEDNGVFSLSTVRWVRVNNLAGFGIRHIQCWDCAFLSISVERCGREGVYAFEVATRGPSTCNETSWVRLQVEQSVSGAIRIDPATLSCSFVKIHSERAIASGMAPTWLLGGACIFDSVRLTAANPGQASAAVVSNQADIRNLRVEGSIPVSVDASGGVVNFHNPSAELHPSANQSGIVNVVGGTVSVLVGAGWNLFGCAVSRLEAGFMPPDLSATVSNCSVGQIAPQAGSDQGELVLTATRVAGARVAGTGRLRALHLFAESQLTPEGGTLSCVDQTITVDASSRIVGSVVLQRATLRLAGTVTGALAIRGPVHDARASDGAVVGGPVTGWGPPSVPGTPGAWSANLALSSPAGQATPSVRVVTGWRYAAGAWRAMKIGVEP